MYSLKSIAVPQFVKIADLVALDCNFYVDTIKIEIGWANLNLFLRRWHKDQQVQVTETRNKFPVKGNSEVHRFGVAVLSVDSVRSDEIGFLLMEEVPQLNENGSGTIVDM